MRIEIRFTRPDYDLLHEDLLQEDGFERAAYLFAGPNEGTGYLTLTVREVWLVPPEAYAHQSRGGLEVKSEYIQRVLRHAYETRLSLLEAHSHPFSGLGVGFSGIDTGDESQKFPYVAAKIPHVRHGTMVLGRASVGAHLYDAEKRKVVPVDRVTVVGAPVERIIPTGSHESTPEEPTLRQSREEGEVERYNRQVMVFGPVGQKTLRQVTIGLVGLGSVGMLLAQQLAYLGVRRFILVDPDLVELSNLNRLVGATPSDGTKRAPKVRVASRLIQAIAPQAEICEIAASVYEEKTHRALKSTDVLFGGTDNHGSRLVLNDRLAVQYLIPYVDVGTGLAVGGVGEIGEAGGWVRVVVPGQWCLHCINVINREEAALDLLSPAGQELARRSGYITGADVPTPAVVFLNSVLASLAVAEFMNLMIGFKPPHHLILYDLLKQRTTPMIADKKDDCASCSPEGLLALADIEPFPAYGQDRVSTITAPNQTEMGKEESRVSKPGSRGPKGKLRTRRCSLRGKER